MKNKTNQTVQIFIPKRFKGDDVRTVSVNGKYKSIPTGKHFFVERPFAEVISNAMLADELAEKFKNSIVK